MNLSTNYLGLKLESPVVVSACTLSEDISNIVRMEDAGAGAVVMFSLFEEQIRQDAARYDAISQNTSNLFAEASDFFPGIEDYHVGPYEYLEKIRQAKARTSLPIIGSLNGVTNEGWIEYAKLIEEAGADALEVNIFFIPADIHTNAAQVEQRYVDIVKAIRRSVRIPVSVKLSPYFSAIGNMARRLYEEGANGLVLFNRFYQPDFDIQQLKVLPNLQYSEATEIRLPLLWLAILHGRVPVSLAATSGVNSEIEVIKYLLAGADVAMTASTLYRNGIDYITVMNHGIRNWMKAKGFESIQAFKGVMSQQNISDPTAYERANYIKILESKR
ncbi:dihydroorotate dehydrogenase-like protein [Phnomibacter ginsenosidimutans]|uniref:Dihydroorotate dehydrogenase-like protein n=1 Tax=Phnomibacter ginsenosidimutans TaxID=2676868 RepID=A0A6I6GLH9_9BACT|nr:dihydroorotate dehydrogenase-like protein [Phnomibacter ginsenosidimutans]QGW29325.1 dihydroorotate dehydrogenase-like protein [Phnomibacter ginsenosidimutans]